MLGGRRVWVIITRGVAKGLAVAYGRYFPGEVGPGAYEGEYSPHPKNPDVNAIKVFVDPNHEENPTYLIPETLPLQNVEFQINDSDESNEQHG